LGFPHRSFHPRLSRIFYRPVISSRLAARFSPNSAQCSRRQCTFAWVQAVASSNSPNRLTPNMLDEVSKSPLAARRYSTGRDSGELWPPQKVVRHQGLHLIAVYRLQSRCSRNAFADRMAEFQGLSQESPGGWRRFGPRQLKVMQDGEGETCLVDPILALNSTETLALNTLCLARLWRIVPDVCKSASASLGPRTRLGSQGRVPITADQAAARHIQVAYR
jgi:hypothetical protein